MWTEFRFFRPDSYGSCSKIKPDIETELEPETDRDKDKARYRYRAKARDTQR